MAVQTARSACYFLQQLRASDAAGAAAGAGAAGAGAAAAPGWPTSGDTVHTIITSNGGPYLNYQVRVGPDVQAVGMGSSGQVLWRASTARRKRGAGSGPCAAAGPALDEALMRPRLPPLPAQTLALYGSWRRARRMPGGEKMVGGCLVCAWHPAPAPSRPPHAPAAGGCPNAAAPLVPPAAPLSAPCASHCTLIPQVGFTRILHRSAHDELSPFIPTFRATPKHPGMLVCLVTGGLWHAGVGA